jgi:protein tyrosine phosphatase (PTP) superfamily phosphohydrolase (DUF442 family)
MAIEDIRNFVPVSEDLTTGGQPSEQQVRELTGAGIEVVVNLGLLDPRYCLPDEAGLVRSLGMAYHHIPVDFKQPRVEELRTFVDVMDACRGKKVFVHCAANYRVSSFVALYGQLRLGWTADDANALVARVWEPTEAWQQFMDEARRALSPGPDNA